MATKESLRAHALELASRHGYPPDQTLKAAREYHDFLSGVESHAKPAEWLLASLASAQATARKAPAKKASPRPKRP